MLNARQEFRYVDSEEQGEGLVGMKVDGKSIIFIHFFIVRVCYNYTFLQVKKNEIKVSNILRSYYMLSILPLFICSHAKTIRNTPVVE